MPGMSSRIAADLQARGFAGALDCSSVGEVQAETARELGTRSRIGRAGARKSALAKLLRVIATVLAIVAGPVLASLTESHLPPPAKYARPLHLRGSIAFNGDLRLRGSIR